MDIHSQEIEVLRGSSRRSGTAVVLARDKFGDTELILRSNAAPDADVCPLVQQFNLHRQLSQSGVVGAHDLVVYNGEVTGFTTPLLEGCPLTDYDFNNHAQGVLAILRDAAFAIFGMHTLGFLHGDLSPANVWCRTQGAGVQGMLIDLGYTIRSGATISTEIRGTRGFIAPEAMDGRPLGPAADAFAFGALVTFCMEQVQGAIGTGSLAQLAAACLLENERDRLSDFGRIYFKLIRIGRESVSEDFGHSPFLLPLRPVGQIARSKTLLDRVTSDPGASLHCIFGPSGSGKSELLRHICHTLQAEGRSTVRISGASVSDSLEILGSHCANSRSHMPEFVFVDDVSEEQVELELRDTRKWRSLKGGLKIVVACRSSEVESHLRHWPGVCCRPLTLKECMHATSHLLSSPEITGSNTEALVACTRGNPGHLGHVMTEYFLSGRRDRGEPVDFCRYTPRAATDAGWNDETRPDISKHDSPDTLLGKLIANRRRASNSLQKYRQSRSGNGERNLLFALDLSEQFGVLGSIARRTRWLQRTLQLSVSIPLDSQSEEELIASIRVFGIALPPSDAIRRLSELMILDAQLSARLRFLIRSELGRVYLLMRDAKSAHPILLEARALCKGFDWGKEHEAMLSNRLGAAKMMAGELSTAREYFTQAARSAEECGDTRTIIAVSGNLGFLELQCADPTRALRWIRRRRLVASSRHYYFEYATNLLAETRALVDLGRVGSAECTARLALSLSETLSDSMRAGFAQNNLGWILTMRCAGREALGALQESLRIRESIGDTEAIAQSHLNLARLQLISQSFDKALESIQRAEGYFAIIDDLEGELDCQRLHARRLIFLQEFECASTVLQGVLAHLPMLPSKDLTDALLLKLELLIWIGERDAAKIVLREIDDTAVCERVHPLRIRRESLSGMLMMEAGDLSAAYKSIASAISMCRASGRNDLLLDVVTIMAILADRLNNPGTGLRYLEHVIGTTKRLREEIE